jgi:diguanylate cyclase (GGDEF)-like protein
MEPSTLRNAAPPERRGLFFGYFTAVVVLGTIVVAASLGGVPREIRSGPLAFWLMAALAVLVDARPFSTPGRRDTSPVYPSICFTFAILLFAGIGSAVLVQTAAVLVVAVRMRHAVWRAAFNAGQYALSFVAADTVLEIAPPGALITGAPSVSDLVVVLLAAAAWFLVNDVLVTTAVWLRFGGSWWSMASAGIGHEALATGALLLLGPGLTVAARSSAALIPLIFVPLYAVERMARLSGEQERAALLDPLTSLANRKALLTEVGDQIAVHAERAAEGNPQRRLALLLLDLDRFKHVNDALGHGVGDELLVSVAQRLRDVAPPGGLVARLGGDEFAIVVPALADTSGGYAVASRIADALAEPVLLDGLPVDVGGSIGIAIYPEHGGDVAMLMRHADVAMYDAKHRGDAIAFYQPESDHNSPERLSLLADLRRALETPGCEEIALYYQPQVALGSGAVVGVEALLRWRHPVRGFVNPEELIRVAEHTAVMRLLTRRVIDDVVAQVAKWAAEGLNLRASLNVSVRDLHTGEIVAQLSSRLTEYGVPADRIQLEITEGALMADPRRILATIARVSALGVAISLDDFGTGYSSLQHLRRLPLTEVKVDRSFVLGMVSDSDDAAIVRSTIELARALNLRVVAEGVENEPTWRLLVEAGCCVAQGWFFSRPMPGDELIGWLARYRAPAGQGVPVDK